MPRAVRRARFLIVLVTATASGFVVAHGASPVAAATVPAGFTDELVVSTPSPTAIEVLPDGRLVLLEQEGRLRVSVHGTSFDDGVQLPNVCVGSERGLLGFTHDPGYLTNRHVYAYYTRQAPGAPGGCVNRVSRFTMTDTVDPSSEVVLLDDISSINGNHNAGDLDVGSDGFLYVSTGDAGRDPRGVSGSGSANAAARDLSHLNGKILRITLDGRPAPGNPLTGPGTESCAFRGATPSTPTTSCQEIFAWGLRNPYRFAFDPNGGGDRFFINDVGQLGAEEINEGGIGLDYGWNVCEGPCQSGAGAGFTDPIAWYPRSVGTYITAGAFVPDGLWPAELDGAYLFADGGSGDIFVMAADGTVDFDAPWATGASGLADMVFAFDRDGRLALYYTLNSGDELRKITWRGATEPPNPTGLSLETITPTRVYDTRSGLGADAGRVRSGTTRLVDLHPPSSDVRAALVNLTMTDNAGWGFLQTWSPRTLVPTTSVVNVAEPVEDVANAAVVVLDEDGRFVLHASTATHVVVDVLGWFSDGPAELAAGRVVPVDPSRAIDTRQPAGTMLVSGVPNSYSRGGDRVDVAFAGAPGMPDDGSAAAVVVSLTALSGSDPVSGYVTAYPAGTAAPGASNVNVNGSGDIRANLAIVPLGATDAGGGGISLDLVRVDHVLIDVVAYVTSPSAPVSGSGLYSSVAPSRVYDERASDSPRLPPGGTLTVDHRHAVPSAGAAGAMLQNLTITGTDGFDYVSAYPAGTARREVSSVNATTGGQTRAALALTPYGTGAAGTGRVTYFQYGASSLIVDVVGIFSR